MNRSNYPTIISLVLFQLFALQCIQTAEPNALDSAEGQGALILNALLTESSSSSSPTCEDQGGKCLFVTAGINGDIDANGDGTWYTEADAVCTAQRPSELSGEYKAMLASSGSNRRASGGGFNWVLQPETSYYRYEDNALVGKTTLESIFQTYSASFSSATTGNYWSGLTSGYSAMSACASNCTPGNHWDDSTNGRTGCVGSLNSTNNTTAVANGNTTCDQMLPIVCAQQ